MRDLAAALEQAGVPRHVADYVQKQQPSELLYWFGSFLYLPIVIAGFAFGAFWLWPKLDLLTEDNAVAAAEQAGAVLLHYNFGFSLLIALFGWIFAAGAIASLIVIWPRMRASSFAFGVLNANSALARWGLNQTLATLATETDPRTYVHRFTSDNQRWMTIGAVVLLTLSALAVQRDVQAHELYTPTHYIDSPFFPWGSRTPKPYTDVVRVELGCNHIERDGVTNDVIYRMTYRDGERVSLDSTLTPGNWLDALEIVDSEVRRSGATFQRWDWLGRDPLHPNCIAAMRRVWGEDYPRLERIMRVGEFPGDRPR